MNLFRKKMILNPLHKEEQEENRRNFIRKSVAALFGATILTSASDIFSMESKTGYIYVKQNGEVINNYNPQGDAQPYLGSIVAFGCNFAPNGWYMCNGQILPITGNTALFSLLGTYYGGNGSSTFALPDLRGRVAMSSGQGPGLAYYDMGQSDGYEGISLLPTQMPAHIHTLAGSSGIGTSPNPSNTFLAENAEGINAYAASGNVVLNNAAIGVAGSSLPHNNIQPVLALNFCIARAGIFPARP